MSEFVEAVNPRTQRVTRISIGEYSGDSEKLRGGEPKSKVLVQLEGSSHPGLRMIRKTVLQAKSADRFCKAWRTLVEAGVPTIPTVRKIGRNEILMTDLTAGGGHIFGKHDVFPSLDRYQAKSLTDADRQFLHLDMGAIENRAKAIGNIANSHHVALPHDDPLSLLVRGDGSWDILALDIEPSLPKAV